MKKRERKGKERRKEGDLIKEKPSMFACHECIRVLLPVGTGISNGDC